MLRVVIGIWCLWFLFGAIRLGVVAFPIGVQQNPRSTSSWEPPCSRCSLQLPVNNSRFPSGKRVREMVRKKFDFDRLTARNGGSPSQETGGFLSTSEPTCTECANPPETLPTMRIKCADIPETSEGPCTEERTIPETSGSSRVKHLKVPETSGSPRALRMDSPETSERLRTCEQNPPETPEPPRTDCLSLPETSEGP
jgi:hypothetical protein